MEIERRFFASTPELRASSEGDKRTLGGLGIVFDSWSENLGGFRERILPEAVEGIEGLDIRAFFNHDPSQVLGRTKAGTMRLEVRKSGVAYEIDLPDTSTGRDVYESVKRGDVDGSSFGFTVPRDGDTWNHSVRPAERTIHKFGSILEMGPVSLPAYSRAKVSARALEMAQEVPEPKPDYSKEHERLLLAES